MLASYFSPFDTQLYSVKIAVYSEVSSHFSYYLANRLKSQFKTKYDFVFITDFQQADLIITTFNLPAEECYETPQIIIDPLLTSNDLLLIDQWIEKMSEKLSWRRYGRKQGGGRSRICKNEIETSSYGE